MGQEWACASEPDWYLRTSPLGDMRYQRRIVYCSTDRFRYPHVHGTVGTCTEYGGEVSWKRCFACPAKERVSVMGSPRSPALIPEACVTGTTRFRVRDKRCRVCFQRNVCVSHTLTQGVRRVKLVILRERDT